MPDTRAKSFSLRLVSYLSLSGSWHTRFSEAVAWHTLDSLEAGQKTATSREHGSTVYSLLAAAERGDSFAAEVAFAELYSELHRVAKRELDRPENFASLNVVNLLKETYLDMVAREWPYFPDRERFIAYAARAVRWIIIDHSRNRHARKRGGGFEITLYYVQFTESVPDHRELTRISNALDDLARVEPDLVEVVDLKFFCGFSFAEIAAIRNVSARMVRRSWDKARVYLHRSIGSHEPS